MVNSNSTVTTAGIEEAKSDLDASRTEQARLEYLLCCRSRTSGIDQASPAELGELAEQLAQARRASRAAQMLYTSTLVIQRGQ